LVRKQEIPIRRIVSKAPASAPIFGVAQLTYLFLVLHLAHSNGQVFYTLPILEVGQQAGVADYGREYSKYNLATTP
jgi:hypothetical protein